MADSSNANQVGAVTGSHPSDAAKQLWCSHLGFAQGRLDRSLGLGGQPQQSAPPLPKLGGPEDPGRMIKDWNFYKYRPHCSTACSLNKFGPDFRWPGLNNTPEIRHHLARAKALKLKLLGITLCMQDSGSFLRCNCLQQQYFTPRLEPFFNLPVRYAG